jgi:methyl-accepting chemotaxis protein
MTRFTFSIRARLTLFVMAFVIIVIGLAVSGVLGLRSVDLTTKEIDQKWFAATAVLAEIADRISEYRVTEGYRALALGPTDRAEAELLADAHRREIQSLQNKYASLLGSDTPNAELRSFRAAWRAYYSEHDAWVKADADGTLDDAARSNSSLQQSYKAVDRLTDESLNIAVAISAVSLLLAMWLLVRIRTQITHPLQAITQALSQLAAGSRDIRVPEAHRGDEIGAMAKAFEVFRTNALALEQAHEATRMAQNHAHSLARHDALTGLPGWTSSSKSMTCKVARLVTWCCVKSRDD